MGRAVGFVGLAGLVAVLWLLVLPAAPVSQPWPFPHARHGRLGCTVCHSGAETGARAGLPDLRLCARCHATAPGGISAALWPATPTEPTAPPPWIRVTRVPEHVFFSHRRHVTMAGLDCASCHSAVAEATAPLARPPRRLDMEACLRCHRQESASDDCLACHR
jgi:hypothetical protein